MANSPLAAAMSLYESLSEGLFPSAARPPVYLDKAPEVASGSQLRTPYVVVTDGGLQPEGRSDYGGPEAGSLTLQVFARSLGDVDLIVKAVKFGGREPEAKAGLDNSTLPIDPPYAPVSLIRTRERRSLAGYDHEGQRVHSCEVEYAVTVELLAAGA